MENAQREIVRILLEWLRDGGLISKTTYYGAVDLIHSSLDLPELLRYPVCWPREGCLHECAQNPQ